MKSNTLFVNHSFAMYKATLLFFVIFFLFPFFVSAQVLTGIGTKWSDEFKEWIIYTDDEEIEGELTMRWQMRDDWTAWDYRIDEEIGSIKMPWKNDPSRWDIRGYEEVITARMLWPKDIREWRITNNKITLTFKSRWGNNLNEWILRDEDHGYFSIYMNWEDDPREWVIIDELDEEITLEMKMTLVFIAVFHSSPKF